MTGLNDEDEAMDRRLREAHQLVRFRPEWAENVLKQVASEVAIKNRSDRPVGDSTVASKSWQRLITLAAALMLALLGSLWFTSNHRMQSQESDQPFAIESPSNSPNQIAPAETQGSSYLDQMDEEPRIIPSVIAGPGYLAAQLSNDSEFEIYMVLPTVNLATNN